MDKKAFDELAKTMAGVGTRRRALRLLRGGVLSAALAGVGPKAVLAACLGVGKVCASDRACCEGATCEGRGRCAKGGTATGDCRCTC